MVELYPQQVFLDLQRVSFGFSQEKKIFSDLSIRLEQGKVYALIGGNGAGKTTLFNIITGFHKLRSGKILFKGNYIDQCAPYQINRLGIARTFQDLRVITGLTVRENVILAMQHNPTDNLLNALLPSAFKKETAALGLLANILTENYFLKEVQFSKAGEISYGQQKLLTIACCVANGAEFLLLDEPVAGISPYFRDLITGLILQLKQRGKTILMIEHNIDFVAETADNILFLSDGRISMFDTITALKKSQEAADAYF